MRWSMFWRPPLLCWHFWELFFPTPFLFPKLSKRSCQALQRSSRQDLGCVCLEYKALPAFTIRKEPRESLRDHMGGGDQSRASWSVSSGFVHWLWWIIRVGRDVYKNLCLFLLTSSQAPSGWRDTFSCLQRCLGSDWSTRGPSQLSLNHFCDGAVQTMGGQAFYLGGASVGVLRLVEVCNGDGPSGGFPHLHTGSPPAWALGPCARLFLIPSWRARYE